MEAKCTDETENGLIQKYFFPGFICKILSIKGPKRAKILQNQGHGSKNRSSPVLLKTTKTRKIGRLLVQNSIFEIWGKIKNQAIFLVYRLVFSLSIGFLLVFYLNFE
jgi:hypothetical protein